MKTFDDIDAKILAARQAALDKWQGPRVGDFVRCLDGTYRRFTHKWEGYDPPLENGLQVTSTVSGDGSFYLSDQGYISYSGGLDPIIPIGQIRDTGETAEGSVWFFHHNHRQAHNAVYVNGRFRVYEQLAAPKLDSWQRGKEGRALAARDPVQHPPQPDSPPQPDCPARAGQPCKFSYTGRIPCTGPQRCVYCRQPKAA